MKKINDKSNNEFEKQLIMKKFMFTIYYWYLFNLLSEGEICYFFVCLTNHSTMFLKC